MKQKWGIALVSILIWVGAAITLLGAGMSFFMGSTLASLGLNIGLSDFSGYLSAFSWVAWVGVVIAILYIVLGVFLWKHNAYAWWITFVLAFLSFVSALASMALAFSPMILVGIALVVVEIVALVNRESMDACKVKLIDWEGWG